jgi:peptidoglycan-N-acetylglucosamine deacetylase
VSTLARTIHLTFDDGPEPVWTAAVLDALARTGARATFFVLGERAERMPALLERTLAEGHVVGVHGDRHLRHTEHTRAAIERDTDRALACLAALGVTPTLWRLPWGRAAAWTGELASARGLRIVGWDADTHDWRGDRAAEMVAAVAPHLGDGCVVLAHDGLGPGALRDDCAETVAFVDALADLGVTCEALGAEAAVAR